MWIQVGDGIKDCIDGSDECPMSKEHRKQYFIASSNYHLIGNSFLRAVVWIMTIITLGGNMVKFYHLTMFIFKKTGNFASDLI